MMRQNKRRTSYEQTEAFPGDVSNEGAPTREQLVESLKHEAETLIRSDAVFKLLKSLQKAIPIFYDFLRRERRRRNPSKQLGWLLAHAFRPDTPVDTHLIATFRDLLQMMRKQLEGEPPSADTGEKTLEHLKNLMAIRREPRYWREYQAYRAGKQVSEILREFHPEYEQMHGWEREKFFRKIYNAIQRLVEKFGGPPMSGQPPS